MTMKELESQIAFVEALFSNFLSCAKEHAKNKKASDSRYFNKNFMNKNCSKTVLKRKITLLRQELLNLEKMLESE